MPAIVYNTGNVCGGRQDYSSLSFGTYNLQAWSASSLWRQVQQDPSALEEGRSEKTPEKLTFKQIVVEQVGIRRRVLGTEGAACSKPGVRASIQVRTGLPANGLRQGLGAGSLLREVIPERRMRMWRK
ncbi:hypothetical protein HJG60_010836 [Phyllostomus discolor]|uniref:Uncharacterized protein n=1 Tax=Phyllostomus discolor TaxID=89673 RepID=A0A834ADJ5_9CHIR|nr:hypothetical protein HJG60_010836 [Phyllostomus discolor]